MRYGSWAVFTFVLGASLAGVSCGSDADGASKEAQSPSSGGSNGTGGGSVILDPGTTKTCKTASDCQSAQVCHPFTGTCVASQGQCTSHASCNDASYCEPSLNACLPAASGTPCETKDNCVGGAACTNGSCGCSEFSQQQPEQGGPLDVYLVFDRTRSMGEDCAYVPGQQPPVDSKACYATYALPSYLTTVAPEVETRLAFQFLSINNGCDGGPYSTPLVPLTPLPVTADHRLVQEISDETFDHNIGTDLEGALRGIAAFTAANQTPGREMIGVLMTDGDPSTAGENDCRSETNIGALERIIADHYAATGIRIFIIGMEGATERNLERLARAGGADPHDDFCGDLDGPCHYWNVGDGGGEAVANALRAISEQAAPLPCEYPLSHIEPPEGSMLDLSTLNVRLTSGDTTATVVRANSEAECPTNENAWYYDDPASPTKIHLCPSACNLVTNAMTGAQVSIVGGCEATQILK